jgi:hypothetical protein
MDSFLNFRAEFKRLFTAYLSLTILLRIFFVTLFIYSHNRKSDENSNLRKQN